jgi:hypothetical protein
MKTRGLSVLMLATLMLGIASCHRPYGYRFYPDAPHFAPTIPASVDL